MKFQLIQVESPCSPMKAQIILKLIPLHWYSYKILSITQGHSCSYQSNLSDCLRIIGRNLQVFRLATSDDGVILNDGNTKQYFRNNFLDEKSVAKINSNHYQIAMEKKNYNQIFKIEIKKELVARICGCTLN
ncbi:hypothetical protein ACTA71_000746 [Dictyostelium dimigraforme]